MGFFDRFRPRDHETRSGTRSPSGPVEHFGPGTATSTSPARRVVAAQPWAQDLLADEHAERYDCLAWKGHENSERITAIEAAMGGGQKGKQHMRAIRSWQTSTPGAQAMFRVNELGRVTLGRHEAEIRDVLGVDGSLSNRLGRAPFDLIQQLMPHPDGVEGWAPVRHCFADAVGYLLPRALEGAGVPLTSSLRTALDTVRVEVFPEPAVDYEPLAAAVFTIGARLAAGEAPDARMLGDLAIGATVDAPEDTRLDPSGRLLVIGWRSELNSAQLLRALEHKVRIRMFCGVLPTEALDQLDGAFRTGKLPATLRSHTDQVTWCDQRFRAGGTRVVVAEDLAPWDPVVHLPRSRVTPTPTPRRTPAPRRAPAPAEDRSAPVERRIGRVKFYNTERNFGFIVGDDGIEYFVSGVDGLTPGTRVSFAPRTNTKGPTARNVRIEPVVGPK